MSDSFNFTAGCALCGHTGKKLYYSAMNGQVLCDDMLACRKRQHRNAKRTASTQGEPQHG